VNEAATAMKGRDRDDTRRHHLSGSSGGGGQTKLCVQACVLGEFQIHARSMPWYLSGSCPYKTAQVVLITTSIPV
jgi:hypothetical protein